MSQLTLSIIKPDAVKKHCIGAICAHLEQNGLIIVASKMMHLSKHQASHFYAIHSHRPFFNDLVTFMSSGPILVQVLKGNQAVSKNRELMGHTDPKQAAPNTLRAMFGASIDENAVHGSDSEANAAQEIAFFFSQQDIFCCCDD